MPDTTRLQMSTEPLCPTFLEDDDAGNTCTNGFYKYTYTYLHTYHCNNIMKTDGIYTSSRENIMQPECTNLKCTKVLVTQEIA